ncbi:type IV toxin-antitoxin system AbiEi family antitoxin domain-containing protein [Agrobacterium salinitolerans]|nr:type IV toxin-antitoxin system AbiEi family antitoxin domain-containing protein [Agrobacterium salinitolerans]
MDEDVRNLHPYLERAYQHLVVARRPMAAVELASAGFTRTTLSQLVSSGYVERPVRGVYHVPSPDDDQRVFWAAISLGYDAVFCFTSAASFYGLTEEGAGIPDIAVSEMARIPVKSSFESRVRFHSWPEAARTDDVDIVEIQGVEVRITSPARTVVDMYRHSTLNRERGIKPVIMDTAFVDCLARYVGEGDQNAKSIELRRIAELHGCWEAISAYTTFMAAAKDRLMSF